MASETKGKEIIYHIHLKFKKYLQFLKHTNAFHLCLELSSLCLTIHSFIHSTKHSPKLDSPQKIKQGSYVHEIYILKRVLKGS